jgi:hypothetical protein
LVIRKELAEVENELESLKMISQRTSKCFATILNVAIEEGLVGNEYRHRFSENDCLGADVIKNQVIQDFAGKMRENRELEREQFLILQGEREVEKAILVRAGIYRGSSQRAKMLSM